MTLQHTGLGKGLEALIREKHEERISDGVHKLPLSSLIPNPRQPRRQFEEKALEELAESIKSQGLLQPLLVRPVGPTQPDKYEIIAGERRWRASRLAGLKEVPVLIRALSSQETLIAALIENLQREDLNPIEEALGLQTLKEEYSLSQDDLAQKIGKSRSAIANSLRLLSLPEAMRPLLIEGKLTSGHARALLSITEARAQEYLKNLILENGLSVREAEGLAAGWKSTGKFELPGISNTDGISDYPFSSAEHADKKKSPPKAAPQSAQMLELQNRIGELFTLPVKVTGKESKGKISFTYTSREELEGFIERLSHFALEGESREALAANSHKILHRTAHVELAQQQCAALVENQERHKLEGGALSALKTAKHQALASVDRPSLIQPEREMLARTIQEQIEGSTSEALTGAPVRKSIAGNAPSAELDSPSRPSVGNTDT